MVVDYLSGGHGKLLTLMSLPRNVESAKNEHDRRRNEVG